MASRSSIIAMKHFQSFLFLSFLFVSWTSALSAGAISSVALSRSNPSSTSSTVATTKLSLPLLLPSIADSALASARNVVASATASIGEANHHRRANPRLNNYVNKPRSETNQIQQLSSLLDAQVLRQAAALVAEADAEAMLANGSVSATYEVPYGYPSPPGWGQGAGPQLSKRDNSFWMETVGPQDPGSNPLDPANPSNYVVWRNVMNYGAVGDGVHDDTAAIMKAISDGDRCGGGSCSTTSVKPAVIYFPSGTYLISSSVTIYYNTQMIGNAKSFPVLKAAPAFTGLGVISSDYYDGSDGGSGEWYLDTSNFYRAVRNFIIDIRSVKTSGIACIHWQVGQATSLENIFFFMTASSSLAQVGIFSENGSGGFMADLYFIDGFIGLQCGNQQFTTRNLNFLGCTTGVSLLWDWGWTFKSISIVGAAIGINITRGSDPGGSVYLLDSNIQNTFTGIQMAGDDSFTQTMYVNVQNLHLNDVPTAVSWGPNLVLLDGTSGQATIDSWMYGTMYDDTDRQGAGGLERGSIENMNISGNPLSGGSGGSYFERSRNQYTDLDSSEFINAKVYAAGDGKTDDTEALNDLLVQAVASGRLLYMPAGVYIVTDTVVVPNGARVVGSCWSQIMARGSKFENMNEPHVMVQIGAVGDVGTVEIQDLLFTVQGPTAGAVLVQWNLQAERAGAAAMWDSHYRVGGAVGTQLSYFECPPDINGANGPDPSCVASSLMLHITTNASAYIENSWAWVADHDLDDQEQRQVDIYSARGMLIESQGPVWLYGTASEHSVLYQYQLSGAQNIFMGMIQTESPYYQPSPPAPAPFGSTIGLFSSDPDFTTDCEWIDASGCYSSWALSISNSTNITVAGAGLYSWFVEYDESCVDTQDCQLSLVRTFNNVQLYMRDLYTIGASVMVTPEDSIMNFPYAANDTNENSHPYLSVISAWTDLYGDFPGETECSWNDTTPECIDDPQVASFCDPSLIWSSLDELAFASPFISPYSMEPYALQVVGDMLDNAINNYSTVDNGYDDVFGYYQKYVAGQVSPTLTNYINISAGAGNRFFECSYEDQKGSTTTQDCPVAADLTNKHYWTLTYKFKSGMEDDFYADLLNQTGINSTWINFDGWNNYNGFCGPTQPDETCTTHNQTVVGLPQAQPTGSITVPNPKDYITAIMPNITYIQTSMWAARTGLSWGSFNASNDDAVQSFSTATFLFQQAIENMAEAKSIGEAEEQEEKTALIINIISIVLSVLPFLGDLSEIAGPLAQMFRAASLFSYFANFPLTGYEISQDPFDAPLLILGALGGGGGRGGDAGAARDLEGDITKAGALRREMSDDNIAKLGPLFASLNKQLKDIVEICPIK